MCRTLEYPPLTDLNLMGLSGTLRPSGVYHVDRRTPTRFTHPASVRRGAPVHCLTFSTHGPESLSKVGRRTSPDQELGHRRRVTSLATTLVDSKTPESTKRLGASAGPGESTIAHCDRCPPRKTDREHTRPGRRRKKTGSVLYLSDVAVYLLVRDCHVLRDRSTCGDLGR